MATTRTPRTRITSAGDTRITSTSDTRVVSMADVAADGSIGLSGALSASIVFTRLLTATIGLAGALSRTASFVRSLVATIQPSGNMSFFTTAVAVYSRIKIAISKTGLVNLRGLTASVKKSGKSGTIEIQED